MKRKLQIILFLMLKEYQIRFWMVISVYNDIDSNFEIQNLYTMVQVFEIQSEEIN